MGACLLLLPQAGAAPLQEELSAPSQAEETQPRDPSPDTLSYLLLVVSCQEKGEVTPHVLALIEFQAAIRACWLPFSAELGFWRDKQSGEGRLTPLFTLPFKPCTQEHPQHFGSFFAMGSPQGLVVLYLVIICYYCFVVICCSHC